MPKGPPPQYTRRDCRLDHIVAAVLARGYDQPLHFAGIETADRAKDIKQGFYRCARHRQLSGAVEWKHGGDWVTKSAMWPPDKEADGTITLRLTVRSKAAGRRHLIASKGADRANWDYNPRAAKSQADIDAWAKQGLDEKGHRIR